MSKDAGLVARCVSVCKVPDLISKAELVSTVSTNLLTTGGNVLDAELVIEPGAEDAGFQRWILQLNSASAVKNVLSTFSKEDINVGTTTYTIEYQPSTKCELPEKWKHGRLQVLVSNIPQNALNEEYIQMTFESKQFGGFDVANVEIDKENNQAIVEFCEPQAVQLLLQKHPIKIKEREVDVRVYDPESEIKPNKIVVSNIPQNALDEEFIQMTFESKQLGGLDVAKVEIDENNNQAIVEFCEPHAVELLLQKCPIKIKGREVDVRVYVPEKVKPVLPVEEIKPNKVVVSNIPQNALDEEFIWMTFESKQLGGLDVANVEIDKENNQAIVEFCEPQAVELLLQKCPIKIKGKAVDVHVYVPEQDEEIKPNKMMVSNIPQSALNEEYIRITFESKQLGGLDVASVEIDEENNQAIVEFCKPQAVDLVLQKIPIKIAGKEVDVVVYIPEQAKEVKPNKIIVTNIPAHALNEQYIQMTFESKQFGGIDVVNVEIDEANSQAIVEFCDPQVVESVLQKVPLKIAGAKVDVCAYVTKQVQTDIKEATKILVSNLPTTAGQEHIEMFFESRLFGGWAVANVELAENGESAIVEFEEPEAVKKVMNSLPISINGKTVIVDIYTSEPVTTSNLKTIEVRGPEDVVCQSTLNLLETYFKSTKTSGGDRVVGSSYLSDKKVALITFETEEVARQVLKKGSHVINKFPISVQLHIPENKCLKQSYSQDNVEEDVPEPPLCTVKIKGFPKSKSRNSLQYYFESKRSGGGGEVTIYSDDEEKEVLYAKFETKEVAQSVIKKTHKVEACDLEVTLHKPPKPKPYYLDRVLIKGLNPKTTKDGLFNFIEAKTGSACIPSDAFYHAELEDVVLVTTEKLDYKKLENVCKQHKLESAMLQLSRVPVSNCVVVSNLKPDVTKDTVEYYFENKRKSGGGEVDKVVMQDDGKCFVYFNDYHVIKDVLSREHKLCNETVTVKQFQECLGSTEGEAGERKLNIPKPITISDLDSCKIRFLKQSAIIRDALENQVSRCYTKVQWPITENENTALVCTLTKDVKDCFKLAKDWGKISKESFESFMNSIVVQHCYVLQDIWETVMKSIQFPTPDQVAVLADKQKSVITVVGRKQEAENIFKLIEEKIKQISDEAEKQKQKITETITMKPIEMQMLQINKFPNLMAQEFPELKVQINTKNNEIIFDGLFGDVRDAKLKMYEMKSLFVSTMIENLSEQSTALYSTKQTRDFIVSKLELSNLKAAWETVGNSLLVCSDGEANLAKCVAIIKGSVMQHSLSLDTAQTSVLRSEQGISKLAEWHSKNEGKCHIYVKELVQLIICCTDDIMNNIQSSVNAFVSSNAIYEDQVSFIKSIHRLIEKHHKQEISDISRKLGKSCVDINYGPKYSSFKIKGTQECAATAKEQLNALANKIIKKEHSLNRLGIAKYLQSAKGKDNINTIENTLQCVIEVIGQYDTAEDGDGNLPKDRSSTIKIHAECKAYDIRTLVTAEGDLTELSVDVIVNTADEKLSLIGGLGKVIASKGGPSINKACEIYIRDNGPLSAGEAFVCAAGNLQAKHIVHVMGPTWKDGEHKEDEMLTEAIFRAMKQASLKKATSMALPAISCGAYGYPLKRATSIIVKAVKNYFREDQDSSISKVYLCDVKVATVQGFTDALKTEFGAANVTHFNDVDEKVKPKPMPTTPNVKSAVMSSADDTVKIKNINVTIAQGEIAKQKVDVIENTTGSNLELKSGIVSASLLEAAGPGIQKEISKLYPNGIKYGEVAITSGHNLKCKSVVHGCLPNWKDKSNTALKALQDLMRNCLNEAHTKKHSSIAFPAMGTGNLGYPRDIVAKEMFTEISKFSQDNPQSSVNDIRIVLYHKDIQTIEAFQKEVSFWKTGERRCKPRTHRTFDPLQQKIQHPGHQHTQVLENTDPDKATLFIFSFKDQIIQKAIETFNKCLEKESYHKDFNKEKDIIKKLQDFQVMEIKAIAQQHQVQLKINHNEGLIIIDGLNDNVIQVSDQIHSILRDTASEEHNRNTAELMTSIVQWFWMQVDQNAQTFQPYEAVLNYKIEEAYKKKLSSYDFICDNGEKYVIDFATMTEHPVNDQADSVNVIRRDLIKESSSALPQTWSDMKGNVLVVPLKATDKEYADVAKIFKTSSKANTVHKIERIQNKTLWQQYQAKKDQLDNQNPPNIQNEKLLWHGTAFDIVDTINSHGFNRSYCNRGENDFGDGVLFAVDATFSCDDKYSKPDSNGKKRMYYCRVLTGEFTQAMKGMRVLPSKSAKDNTLYDSVTNDLQTPNIFVIFHDTQAYPEYLIEFNM